MDYKTTLLIDNYHSMPTVNLVGIGWKLTESDCPWDRSFFGSPAAVTSKWQIRLSWNLAWLSYFGSQVVGSFKRVYYVVPTA